MKKKTIRRSLSLLCAFALLFSLSISAAAAEENHFVTTISEYELVRNLAAKSAPQLCSEGYSTQEISQIKNYNKVYTELICELQLLDNAVLEEHGYTQSQINDIRNFNGAESQMARISATLTLSAATVNFNYDGNYSRGRLAYTWSWSGIPGFKLQDMVAVSWNGWAVESQSSAVNYCNVNTGSTQFTESAQYSNDGNGTLGGGHKFSLRTMQDDQCYAKYGSGGFNLRSDVHAKKDLFYYMEYGHAMVLPTISFSVSGSGGLKGTISFHGTVVAQDSVLGQYIFK